jgi:uncharacterized protein DUF6011
MNTTTEVTMNGHDSECICVPCMMADLDATILANGGQDALDRVNSEMALIGGGKVEPERKRFMAAGSNCGSGKVRPATVKMVKYLKFLLDTREINAITIYPGQYATIETAHRNSWQSAIALIDKLTNAPIKASAPIRMATHGQKNYIASLNDQIKDPGYKITEADINSIKFSEVQDTLDLLKAIIKAEKEDNKGTKKEITEGAYWYGDLIARVQKSRSSGRLYAKLQSEVGAKTFVYAPGLLNKLNPEDMLSVEDMKVFAQAHKACADCGTAMTHPVSIARGIGPVCSGKGYKL